MIFALAAAFAAMTDVGAVYFVLPPTALGASIAVCLSATGLSARGA
jgi:hypothetical protein